VLAVQGLGGFAAAARRHRGAAQAYVPRWASGEWIAAYALHRPAAAIGRPGTWHRPRDGGDWVLDGTKRFITNAGGGATYVVFPAGRGRDHGVHG
jgi:alkylation response protein AidB-like acyl-CoA dehydrogenase